MKRALAATFAIVGICVVAGSAALYAAWAPARLGPMAPIEPVWAETQWPFPIDEWGTGKAFVCQPANCGVKVEVFIRPKIGYCNCSTGVSDDAELERVSDTGLVARKPLARAAGTPIKVGWMDGRSRLYAPDVKADGSLLSVAFNDECDVVVALARIGEGGSTAVAPAAIAFLQSKPMVLWAKKELGLEFARRDW